MPQGPAGKHSSPTPRDLEINVRDLRFGRSRGASRWWLGGDPVASCWHLSLSATFPRGEAFFIEAVKAHRDGADPALADAIGAFIAQEVNHSREHIAFNRQASDNGYDLSGIEQRLAEFLAMTRDRPAILNLASTIALEHFTAMFAADMLRHRELYAGAEPGPTALWCWHAIEEIEHKGVAYDTWLHATRNWSRWQRWRVKSLMMLLVTKNFVANRIADTLDLLAQDGDLLAPRGLAGWRVRLAVFTYLFGRPGVLRRILPAWASYFLPGFHPWNLDDRALIAAAEAEIAAAARPTPAEAA